MRTRRLFSLASACAFALSSLAAGQSGRSPATTKATAGAELRLTYLGNAGWEITDGRTVVLVDPYVSQFSYHRDRPLPAAPKPGQPPAVDMDEILKPDTAAIDQRVPRADYILITHGHEDHMLDAPYISRRTGAAIIGHETAANIARAYDVPENQLITVRGGEDYEFEAFSLRVVPSLHTAVLQKRYNNLAAAGTAPRGLRAPLRRSDFAEGGSLAYLLRMAGQKVLIMGSMNYIEREMEGLRPDVALVGANRERGEIYDYAGRLMRALGHPRLVIATHSDGYSARARQNRVAEDVQAFTKEVKAASADTQVVIPKWFEPIVVPARK
jgi:L-ascorbate metabolism protein UlaG (beta-lactamase superfamily)